ncbi:MAG: nuclease-related domain-containing protein, partial [Campylobacterales bacterium]
MILKQIDDKSPQIKVLEELYSKSQSQPQKKLIKADLDRLRAGHEAEKENAYYLDFGLKDSKNIILLHDIRIVHDDRTAQLDHVLISRLGIEVLETKSSKGSIAINDDGSLTYQSGKYKNTYPNPLEQSKRHAQLLKQFIEENITFPKRVMLLGGVEVTSRVLIHPKTTIANKTLPEGFERADSFISAREKETESISTLKAISALSRLYDIDKAKEIANLLLESHTPIEFDYT